MYFEGHNKLHLTKELKTVHTVTGQVGDNLCSLIIIHPISNTIAHWVTGTTPSRELNTIMKFKVLTLKHSVWLSPLLPVQNTGI